MVPDYKAHRFPSLSNISTINIYKYIRGEKSFTASHGLVATKFLKPQMSDFALPIGLF